MALKVAVQMDPVQHIVPGGDSTVALMLEAAKRGHHLCYYTPDSLTQAPDGIFARVAPIAVKNEPRNWYRLGEAKRTDLSGFDVILLRQDPPFNMAYITTTHILERLQPKVLVINDPAGVRNAPEKILVTHFADLMPPTLITRDREEVRAFRAEQGDVILKPLYGNGGAGIFRLAHADENFAALLELFSQTFREPFIAQKYLAEVRKGDKRIILIDGKAVGVINRVPAEGEARSNMHVGGVAVKDKLSKRDVELCEIIGPELARLGLLFVGIDVIGDYLTEINVTSPTGLQQINRFDGVSLEAQIWDSIEARFQESRGRKT
jgi:glutathione synthase